MKTRKRWSLGLPANVFWLGMVSFMNDFSSEIAGPVTALVLIPLLFGSGPLQPTAYRVLFGIAAVPAMVSVIVLLLLVHEPPRHESQRRQPAGEARLSGSFWYLLCVLTLFTLG